MKLRINCGNIEGIAVLLDTKTAKTIYQAAPFESNVRRWGREIYFDIPVTVPMEKIAKEIVAEGDIAYWPEGRCFCIFFGKTPASVDERPRAASPVNIFGRIVGDYTVFEEAQDGEKIHITHYES